MNKTHNQPLAVYTVVASNNEKGEYWHRIGAAFENRDQSLTVRLNSMPFDGKLIIRPASEPRQDG